MRAPWFPLLLQRGAYPGRPPRTRAARGSGAGRRDGRQRAAKRPAQQHATRAGRIHAGKFRSTRFVLSLLSSQVVCACLRDRVWARGEGHLSLQQGLSCSHANTAHAHPFTEQEDLDRLGSPDARAAFRSSLFGLCFFHSLVVGRKKFGTGIGPGPGSGMGFCRPYR